MLPQRTNASATILCLLMVVILNTVYGVEQESVQQLQMICSNKFVRIEQNGSVHANDASDHPQTITILSDISDLLQRPKTIPIKLFVKDVNMFLCYNHVWKLEGVEKQKMKSNHRCEFYEEENRGYFRFRSTKDAGKYVSFFKGGGKPFRENQKRPKKVCSEFVKAHLQPMYNYPFDPMPRELVPVRTTTERPTTIATTTTPTTTTTTPAPPRTSSPRSTKQPHKHRHQKHKEQQQEVAIQEFSAPEARHQNHHRHHHTPVAPSTTTTHHQQKQLGHNKQQSGLRRRKNKKKHPNRSGSTTPKNRNVNAKKQQQQQQPEKQMHLDDVLFPSDQDIEREHTRARAAAEESMRRRRKQRLEDFGVAEQDYWNDDNMIGSVVDGGGGGGGGEVTLGSLKSLSKRQPSSSVSVMATGKQHQPQRQSDSIHFNRLKPSGVGSAEQKGTSRRKPIARKRGNTAHSKDNFSDKSSSNDYHSNSSSSSRSAGSINSGSSSNIRKYEPQPQNRLLVNHHHHPNLSSIKVRGGGSS